MQWSGNTIYVAGPGHDIVRTSAKRIHEIWPGTRAGSFVVLTDAGLGLLLGRDIIQTGPVVPRDALLRTSRQDGLWGALPERENGADVTTFIEWRGSARMRRLVTVRGRISDFDVDRSGRIVYLTADRRIAFIADAARPAAEIVRPSQLPSPERIFADADLAEIAVLSGRTLARLDVARKSWTMQQFDPRRQALVRHVASRRILVERRFPQ